MEHSLTSQLAQRTRDTIKRRILPFIFVLYIIAFLDRVNVGYAQSSLVRDLRFTKTVFALGAGIFFLGYFLLEVPGSVIAERWSARKWIARIMITWGIVAALTGLIQSAGQFYILRFILGAAEAGFFPGIIVYLHHWLPNRDRAKAVAVFMAAIPVSEMLGAPISGSLLSINWLHLEGWRWLFIFEGFPAVILGFLVLFYMTDWPLQAKWLRAEEIHWINSELARERESKQDSRRIFSAFRDRRIYQLTVAYFLVVTSAYGVVIWLPGFVKEFYRTSESAAAFITGVPYTAALIAMLLVGWSSDRRNERHKHAGVSILAGSFGLLLSGLTYHKPALALAMFSLATAGLHAYLPAFWSLPTSFLKGSTAAATIGLINALGSLGGLLGTFAVGYLTERRSFVAGVLFLAVPAFIAAILILGLPRAQDQCLTSQKI